MALATKCPHCNTIFRVAADQLKLRGGIVRCGSCHQVFDGNSALVEPAAKPTPVIPDVVAERAAPAHSIPAISDYVHGTPVDFELDFADEPAPATPAPAAVPAPATPAPADLPTAAKPAEAAPQAAAPSPAVWRSATTHAPAAEPTPDDTARAAVARAFAAATTPPSAPPASAHPLASLVSPDDTFSELAGEPPTTGPWSPEVPAPAAAVPSAATPSSTIDEKLLVWEDIPANASAASDAAAMAAVARAFNNVTKHTDRAPEPEHVVEELAPDIFAVEAEPQPPQDHRLPVEAPSETDDELLAAAEPPAAGIAPVAEELPATDIEPVTEELPGTDIASVAAELPATDIAPVAEELPATAEAFALEEVPAAAEEPPAADELPAPDVANVPEELPAADESFVADEVPAATAAIDADKLPAADEPPAAGIEPTAAEDLAAAEETPAIEAEQDPAQPPGAALIDAIDQWSADNTHPDGRIEPSLDTPQEHIVLAAIDDAHHFEDLPPAELPQEEHFTADFGANVEAEANEAADADAGADTAAAEASIADTSEPSLAEEPWPAAEDAADALAPTGEPWSLSEPEQERDDTALHAVAAVNTDVPDDGESLPSDEEQAAAEAALAAARMRALAGVDEAEDLDHSDLSFVKRVDRSQKYGKAATISMAIGIPLLLAGLALQAGTTFRDTLAANYPQLKPALAAMCQPLGCKIALPTQLDALSIEQGELATMAESTFSFTTVLRNQSKTAQTWPHIELTLNDNADKPVLRRVFAPREYLPSPAEAEKGFGPRSEQSIKLYFELKELKASGYHIAIFYP